MSWMTKQQGRILLRFLEIEPPRNHHGNIKTRYLCFYSSELKNLKQIADSLNTIESKGWHSLDDGTRKRYQNTLQNLGLIKLEDESNIVISDCGNQLIDFLNQNKKMSVDLNKDNPDLSIAYEKIILKNIISIVKSNKDGFSKCYEYGKKLLFELQSLKNILGNDEYLHFCDDLDRLLFLQVINSSGAEIRRFFNLALDDQKEGYSAWNDLKSSSSFPKVEPSDFIERMAYFYTKPIAEATIQSDIRYRVKNCIMAYQELIEDISLPLISNDYKVISSEIHSASEDRIERLAPKNERNSLNIPNQLIVSGCPGSGKSRHIQDLLSSDKDAQITMVTMHPDYTYSDLVGCYKPVPIYEVNDKEIRTAAGLPFIHGSPKIDYQFVVGPLVEVYCKAIKNKNYNFVLVIEEINRTNCNSLFGDFFQLLDRSITFESTYEISAMPDLRDFLIKNQISPTIRLPRNLYLLGTMNSADQGVFPLDSAFRRRWSFEYIGYKTRCLYEENDKMLVYGGKKINWDLLRSKINKSLAALGVHEDKLIGPYFLTTKELNEPKSIQNKLFLYLWDDVLRFQRRELMAFDSFADLVEEWDGGNGSPLKINVD